jgi:hypothetical protein
MEILDKLLRNEGTEREHYLISLGEWEDSIPFTDSEEDVARVYRAVQGELAKLLGQPSYSGAGLRCVAGATEPDSYFDAAQSALRMAWWKAYGGEVAIFHTEHDAGSLQFVILAVSNSCVLPNA